jgi:hypothetical protein|tara:strand:+ start:1283 stop:1807 length:525 start_codon:yes stop_codon:yes gene_type:complete
MPQTNIDPFAGAIPGESWTREFGSLPMDKPPMTVNPEEAYRSLEEVLDNPSTQRDITKLIKTGLSIETLINSFVTEGVSKGVFNPDVAELVKPALFFKIFSIVQDKVKNILLFNPPLNEEISESSLEGIGEKLSPDNEYLKTEEEDEAEKRIEELLKNMNKEEGFMTDTRIGEI